MNPEPIIIGRRRFTCLAPGLVRLEFSPTGAFEDRPSLVASEPRRPVPFESVVVTGDKAVLQTGVVTITTQQNERDFFYANLRIDWQRDGLTQTWQYGDRDYRNLGGTVRSLDYYTRDGLLQGVHPASADSPDVYLHDEAEFWEVMCVYAMDGKIDWQIELGRIGAHGALRHAPHLVYNRNINMAEDLTRYPPGLLSPRGYFLLNDSRGPVLDEQGHPRERNTPGSRDLYFLAYNEDYKLALGYFRLLSGAIPLPTRHTLGIMFCRWPAFSEPEARGLIDKFQEEGIPLSVLVLDVEWHVPDFWHWDWNPQTYPDPQGFLQWAHSQGVQVAVNVHPKYLLSTDSHFEPYIAASRTQDKIEPVPPMLIFAGLIKSSADHCLPLDLANKAEAQAITRVCLEPLLEQGVDFIWLDMNAANLNGADGQLVCSKVFYEGVERPTRRGMLLSRYGGLGSHRYGAFFTGDTASQWEVLRSECEFTIRAGQVGMAYVSHDIGGFSHSPAPLLDPDLYLRWLQFGVFSPVLRFHSAPEAGSRQPWDYGSHHLEIARRYLKLRHSLIPYLYAAARQAYERGLPLVRGLFLEYPHDQGSYRFDEYFLGDSLLVAPVLSASNHRQVYLPPGQWYDFDGGQCLPGGQEIYTFAPLERVPVYVKAGAILVRQEETASPTQAFIENLCLDIYPGADGEGFLYEDDGQTLDYQQGSYCLTCYTLRQREGRLSIAGQAAQGKPFGQGRRVSLQVALENAPAKILLRDIPLAKEKYRFDPGTRRVHIDLGVIPVSRAWEISIQ